MKYIIDNNLLRIDIKSLDAKYVSDFFEKYIPSKKMRYLMILNDWILIDDKKVSPFSSLNGNELILNIYPFNKNYIPKIKRCPKIIYEDEFLLIVNKPAGINIHSVGNNEVCLKDYVEYYFFKKKLNCSAQPLHRLDKDTSGLVVFSKSEVFQPLFDQLVKNKEIHRHYLAFVKGKVEKEMNFNYCEPIGKDKHNSNKRVISKKGKKSETIVLSLGTNNIYSVLKCVLVTGRTHQIRVHLSYHKLPILNDKIYGVKSKATRDMGLIGYEILMYHPIKELNIAVQIELNEEFQKIYNLCCKQTYK